MNNYIQTKSKFLIAFICLAFFTLTIISLTTNMQVVFAETESYENVANDIYVEEENLNSFYDAMDRLENEIEKNNSSVLQGLQIQLDHYNNMINSNSYQDKANILSLINTTEDLITKYKVYANRNKTRAPYHAIYTPIIAAAISYFNTLGYYLSAELLTHAKDNNRLNSIYKIEHTNIIIMSTKFQELAFGTSTSGEATFEKGNDNDNDAYYSIHQFEYKKQMPNSRTVQIKDTYDFDSGDQYESLEKFAVEQMYNAQQAGALIPYKISQQITDITSVILDSSNNTTYQETFDLPSSDARNFAVVMTNCSKIRINIYDATNSMSLTSYYFAWDNPNLTVSTNKIIDKTFDNFIILPEPSVVALTFKILNVNMFKNNTMTIKITAEK